MVKIFWDDIETDKILGNAVLLMDSGLTPFEAIKQAQLVLQPDRRRPLNAYSSCVNLIKQLKNEYALHVLRKSKTAELAVEVKTVAPAPAPAPAPLEASLDALVRQLADRFAETIKERVREAVLELEAEFKLQKHDPSYNADKVTRPRIVVIGLLNDQVRNIDHEFGSIFDLKFIDTDRANGMKPTEADAYLLMKNFINHPLYYKYRDFKNHVLIDGGMTSLRTWLHSQANRIIADTNARAKAH